MLNKEREGLFAQPTEGTGTCRYQQSCHFFNIARKNDHSSHLRELYCVKWPEQCQIHQKRKTGSPVPITLWPTGKVSWNAGT